MKPAELASCVDFVLSQVRMGVPADQVKAVLTQTAVLLGLRYDNLVAERLMQSVVDMEDSSVYQAIIRKGLTKGSERAVKRVVPKAARRASGPC